MLQGSQAVQVRSEAAHGLSESLQGIFSTRLDGIASFPAAGSAFTPVTKNTSVSAAEVRSRRTWIQMQRV